ncbi:MAG: flagellar assembly protein FliW [Alphaproteobacteria bacterium]|jgi:flagellar assembly factor FliW|nr:flagellar assembly protein FliW [Candidatus Jidaibacter sp.]
MYNKNDDTNFTTITNQFGSMKVYANKIIQMPTGLIGISHANHFILEPCQIQKFKNFYVLQSTEFQDLALLMQPIVVESEKYHVKKDLLDVIQHIGMVAENTLVMVVVAVKQDGDKKSLTVNARAPIFIDTVNQAGAQFVLPNQEYEIQKALED